MKRIVTMVLIIAVWSIAIGECIYAAFNLDPTKYYDVVVLCFLGGIIGLGVMSIAFALVVLWEEWP